MSCPAKSDSANSGSSRVQGHCENNTNDAQIEHNSYLYILNIEGILLHINNKIKYSCYV